jgi:tRNA pseudouridine38-40 synthase
MRNVRFLLEYDGTDFVGWQVQNNGRSVQGELEGALKELTQREVRVVGAGRTDAGVHARGQVANFLTESLLSTDQLLKGSNALLSDAVRVLEAAEVPSDFHARYSAKERRYRYTITRAPHPMLRRYSWCVGYVLDFELLDRCAGEIRGSRDFRSFCKNSEMKENTTCQIFSAVWKAEGDFVTFEIGGDRFLHGMVRALTGTMIDVSRGHLDFDRFLEIMDSKDRLQVGMTAPARGLVLESVLY